MKTACFVKQPWFQESATGSFDTEADAMHYKLSSERVTEPRRPTRNGFDSLLDWDPKVDTVGVEERNTKMALPLAASESLPIPPTLSEITAEHFLITVPRPA